MTFSNEIIIKQWGSQQQLLVNIQNTLPYSQRHSKLPSHFIQIKVNYYALSNYDVHVRSGKYAFLNPNSNNIQPQSGFSYVDQNAIESNTLNTSQQGNGGSPTLSSPNSSQNNSRNSLSSNISLGSIGSMQSDVYYTQQQPSPKSDASGQSILRMGYEVIGTVLRCGSDVIGFEVGNLVVGWLSMLISNSCQNYTNHGIVAIYEPEVQSAAWNFVKIPSEMMNISEQHIVGSILPGLRAHVAFSGKCGYLRAGESVLIVNAASGEAQIAVQIAARRGAKVFCTVSSEEEWNLLQDLGVDIERIIDTRREKLKDVIMEETGGLGLDWILDAQGTLSINTIISFMGFHARIITTSFEAQYNLAVCRQLLLKNISLSFLFEQTYALGSTQQGKLIHMLNEILQDLKKKNIHVQIQGVYPPEKIREAHRQLENPKSFGRILLKYSS